MRLTIPHYYDFGADREEVGDQLANATAWDGLRVRTSGPFSMAADRSDWDRQARSHPELEGRAHEIAAVAGESSIASYGVGAALLEFWLQEATPQLDLTVTEYAPETLDRLRVLFPEGTVRRHDLRSDPPLDADIHVFHRIDTEFTNRELRAAMRRFSGATVLLIATTVLDLDQVVNEFRQRRNPNSVPAGLYRNRAAFGALWSRTHRAEPHRFSDLDGWILRPKSADA